MMTMAVNQIRESQARLGWYSGFAMRRDHDILLAHRQAVNSYLDEAIKECKSIETSSESKDPNGVSDQVARSIQRIEVQVGKVDDATRELVKRFDPATVEPRKPYY